MTVTTIRWPTVEHGMWEKPGKRDLPGIRDCLLAIHRQCTFMADDVLRQSENPLFRAWMDAYPNPRDRSEVAEAARDALGPMPSQYDVAILAERQVWDLERAIREVGSCFLALTIAGYSAADAARGKGELARIGAEIGRFATDARMMTGEGSASGGEDALLCVLVASKCLARLGYKIDRLESEGIPENRSSPWFEAARMARREEIRRVAMWHRSSEKSDDLASPAPSS